MHVVGHEAEADDGDLVKPAIGFQEIEIHQAVGIGYKDRPARVAALCDVVRHSGHNDTGETSHMATVRRERAISRERSVCPRFSVPGFLSPVFAQLSYRKSG